MAKPEATPSRCLSSILQRLLCARNLPPRRCGHECSTSTSAAADRVLSKTATESTESTAAGEEEQEEEEEAGAAPGIVARLMGLETMPDLPLTPAKVPNPNSLLCRSMNSVEYLLQLEQMQTSGRDRQRTLSFREEVPTFLRRQNKEETERLGPKQGKTREMKQGCKDFNLKLTKAAETGENCSGNRGEENKTSEACDCKRTIKEDSRGSRHISRKSILIPKERPNPKTLIKEELPRKLKSAKKKKKKKKKKKQKSADSESASAAHVKNHHVSGEHSMGIGMDGKKRKSDQDYVRGSSTDHPETPSVVVRNRGGGGGGGGVEMGIRSEAEYYYCAEMVRQVCALSGDDIKKWNWGGGKKGRCEDYEEICVDFGDQIVQQMVCQVVHELSRSSRTGRTPIVGRMQCRPS